MCLGFLALDQAKDVASVHPQRQQAQENATGYDDPISKVQHRKTDTETHRCQDASQRDIACNGKGDGKHRQNDQRHPPIQHQRHGKAAEDTLAVLRTMDAIRESWGMKFSFEK